MSCTSLTDPSVAPEGKENLFFLIPLAPGLKDTDEMREKYFNIVTDRLNELTGNDIKDKIVFKKSYCVSDFEKDYNAFKGNAYGLANTLRQTAVLKPRMKNKKMVQISGLLTSGHVTRRQISPSATLSGSRRIFLLNSCWTPSSAQMKDERIPKEISATVVVTFTRPT